MELENKSDFEIAGKGYSGDLNCKSKNGSLDGKEGRYEVKTSYGGDLIIKDTETGIVMCFFRQ